MTDPTCTVDDCPRPCPDNAYVCTQHGQWLERDLGDVTFLVEELLTTRSGQVAAGEQYGSPSTEAPDPYRVDADSAAWTLGNTITTWARVVVEERGIPHVEAPPRPAYGPAHLSCTHTSCRALRLEVVDDPAEVASTFLLHHVEWLRHHKAGGDAVEEIGAAVRNAWYTIDHRPERWYAGPCQARTMDGKCCTDMYATPGAGYVTCPGCKAQYDVKTQRKWLLDQADDRLAHAELIARALSGLGEAITGAAIRGYAHRGRIVAHTVDHAGRPMYRVGEVRRVAEEVNAERERRGRRRHAA